MLKQFKCEKCDCNRDFIEKDGIFICQTCGTEYSLKYAVNKTIQNLTTEIFGILYESIKPDIDDGSEIANCLWITLIQIMWKRATFAVKL